MACVFYVLGGLLTGGWLGGWAVYKRNQRRPRADVHLNVKRGQSATEMVSGFVRSLTEVDEGTMRLIKEKAYWRERAKMAEKQRDQAEARYDVLESQFEKER